MRTRLPYDGPEGAPFEVPDRNLAAVLEPKEGPETDLDALVADAFAEPLDAPPLAEAARGARSVLLLVDDATRPTPAARVLPHAARALAEAGVPDAAVRVLAALGTHRPMTRAELEAKLGPFLGRWRVAQHDWRDASALVDLGRTSRGMPVVVSRAVAEADLVVGFGYVGVHAIMGYSGGAKIVFPGACGAASEAWTHWNAAHLPREELEGVVESPIRLAIEEAARAAGLDAVLNVAMDRRGRVQRAAYGDFVAAQRACAEAARRLWAAPLDGPVDVVVAGAHPADRDYWQSAKGLMTASLAVRDGGVVVLVCPNPEGVSRDHPVVLETAGLSPSEIDARVASGAIEDVVGASTAYATARVRDRAEVVLVSSGVRAEEARRLGFAKAATPQEGVDEALRRAGPDARVAVLRHAGGLLPVVRGRNERLVAEGMR